jgi:hypothetical protein
MRDERQQRGCGHAEEGHEGGVLAAEVHVGQVEERITLPDGSQQRLGGLVTGKQAHLAEAQATT